MVPATSPATTQPNQDHSWVMVIVRTAAKTISSPPAANMPYRKAQSSFSKSACSPLRTTKVPSMAAMMPAPASSMGNRACTLSASCMAKRVPAPTNATAEMMLPT